MDAKKPAPAGTGGERYLSNLREQLAVWPKVPDVEIRYDKLSYTIRTSNKQVSEGRGGGTSGPWAFRPPLFDAFYLLLWIKYASVIALIRRGQIFTSRQ